MSIKVPGLSSTLSLLKFDNLCFYLWILQTVIHSYTLHPLKETVNRNFTDLARHGFKAFGSHFDIMSGGTIYILNSNGRGYIIVGESVCPNCFIKTDTFVTNCHVAHAGVAALKTCYLKGERKKKNLNSQAMGKTTYSACTLWSKALVINSWVLWVLCSRDHRAAVFSTVNCTIFLYSLIKQTFANWQLKAIKNRIHLT